MLKLKSFVISYWLLIVIIIIASFLRLYNIAQLPPGLYPDEAMNGNNALEAITTGDFKIFYPENNGREGLFINMQALSIYIFGNEPWALRSVSAIFGILTVLGVYFLTKELFPQNRNIALLAAFLLATSFWHINFSRIGFRAITAPFYLTWACYFALKSVRILKENYLSWKIYSFAALGGIFYGLGFHSYIAYRATPLLIIAGFAYRLFYFKELRRQIIKIFIIFSVFSILAFSPLGIYFLQNPQDFFGRTAQISVFDSPTILKDLAVNVAKTAGMFNFSGDWNWRHNYAGKPQLFWPVGILFLVGIFLGLRIFFEKVSRRMSGHGSSPDLSGRESEAESQGVSERLGERNPVFRKEYPQSFIILFLWLVITALPVVISNEGLPHALRAILMIPPMFIFAGVGGVWILEKIKYQISNIKITIQNPKSLIFTFSFYILIFTFCIWLTYNAYYSYFIKWGKNPNVQGAFSADYAQIGRALNALSREMPKYVIVEAQGVDVRGIPMSSQTIMFITDTFTPEKQKEKNIFYVLPDKANQIPENGYKVILR